MNLIKNIDFGDYVDFGQYGKWYIVAIGNTEFKVTKYEGERFLYFTTDSVWIPKKLAKNIIEKAPENITGINQFNWLR